MAERTMFQGNLTGEVVRVLLVAAISTAVGWLLSSLNKVSRKELEEIHRQWDKDLLEFRQSLEKDVARISERVSKFESKSEQLITRTELRDAVDGLKSQFDALKFDLRGDIASLRDLMIKR